MSVFTVGNYDALNDEIHSFVYDNKWSALVGNDANQQRVAVTQWASALATHLHMPGQPGVAFQSCVTLNSMYVLEHLLEYAKSEKVDVKMRIRDQEDLRDRVWRCARTTPVAAEISEITKLDLLLCALVWCAHALVARAYAVFSLIEKSSKTGPKNNREVWVATIFVFTATLCAVGVFGYGVYEVSSDDMDMALGPLVLLLLLLLALVWMCVVTIRHRKYTLSEVCAMMGDTREPKAYNALWLILGALKPLLVAPIYVLIVMGLCGITEFYTLFVNTMLAVVLALVCATLSYYNLYATHRAPDPSVWQEA
eukprot:3815533-Rhodomonas_salina.1